MDAQSDRHRRHDQFAAAIASLDSALDWNLLATQYCEGDAAEFFSEKARDAITGSGIQFATDLARAVETLPVDTPGHSLWFGAAIAELAPILFESIVLDRRCTWINLEGPETEELNRALKQTSEGLGFPLPSIEPQDAPQGGPFDLLWAASVFTDPDHFPELHDELYGRAGTALGVGMGTGLAGEREQAEIIAGELLDRLSSPALVATSDEELPLFQSALRGQRASLLVNVAGRLSGIVGDKIGFHRLEG